MAIKGRYGYKNRKGEIGEVSTTSINVIRTFVAYEDIEAGQPVQIEIAGQPTNTNLVTPWRNNYVGHEENVLGVAVYNSALKDGMYKAGDTVSVLTYGDIRVKVDVGGLIYKGNQVFLYPSGGAGPGESRYKWKPYFAAGYPAYGTFVDSGDQAVDDDGFTINFNQFQVVTGQ